jgi:ADP-heptose:LPS heptosyltransferase
MKQMEAENSKLKIGILRALYLGDMLCIIPTVRAVRSAFPLASITLIGLAWQKTFVERFHHYFDDFVEFPGWPGLPEQPYDPKRIISFIGDMQARSFDIFLQMQGNGESTNVMCLLFGAKKTFGLRKPSDWCVSESDFPVSGDSEHEVLRFLKLTEPLQIPTEGAYLEFPFHASELENVRAHLAEIKLSEKSYICIHPGARDFRRRWPARNFALVADQLASFGYAIVLTGGGEEREVLEEVASHMSASAALNVVKAFGHLPLGELAAVIRYSAGLVTNDTGVSHIASALQIPSVIIFSPFSNPSRWAPLNTQIHQAIPTAAAEDHRSVAQMMLQNLGHAVSLI